MTTVVPVDVKYSTDGWWATFMMLLLLLLGKWSITAVACWSNYKTSSDFIEERCCKLNGLLLESQGKGSLRNSSQSVCDAAGDVLLLLWYIHYRRDFLNTFQWTDYKLLMRPCNGGSLLMMMLVGGPSLQSCLLFRWGPSGSLFFSFFRIYRRAKGGCTSVPEGNSDES